MTCQEFDQIVAELAADKLMSPRSRIAALTHVSVCEVCNERLLAEKVLERGLGAVSERTSHEQAPARMKQSLRAAFEARQQQVAPEPRTTKVIRLPIQKPNVQWRWTWPLAAAAMIVFAVSVFVWRNQRSLGQPDLIADSLPTPTITPLVTSPPIEMVVSPHQTNRKLTGARTSSMSVVEKKSSPMNRRQATQAEETELAANYIPLSYVPARGGIEESLVVRVDVPRASLIAMGLPLSLTADHGSEMVKADLKVGLDGVPLAIRLVQK